MFSFDQLVIPINSLLEITSVIMLIHVLNVGKSRGRLLNFVLFYICIITYLVWVNLYMESKEIFALGYIILFLFAKWQYQMSILPGVIVTVGAVVTVGILEMVYFAPFSLLGMLHVSDSLISFIVVLVMSVTVLFIHKKIPVHTVHKLLFQQEKYSFVVSGICSVAVIYAIISFSGSKGLTFSEYFYVICCVAIIALSSYKLNQYRYEVKLRTEYSEKYGEVLEQIRERQHKFSNQLNAIYALHQLYHTYEELVEKQKEQTDELCKYIMPNTVIILKNPIVIAHVYQKICEAADHGIRLHTKFTCELESVSIPDIYLVEIIGTLFDNAMENILEERPEAEMFLEITGKEDDVLIEVCNEHPFIHQSEWRKFLQRGYSTKGKDRGLGLYHLKKLMGKYNGDIVIQNKMIDEKPYFSIAVKIK
ncbi:MAG: GHKL domain-containing protein [Eubacterium sp.]|nr:GHKL domain-containing protein [Eubacterium sp.]